MRGYPLWGWLLLLLLLTAGVWSALDGTLRANCTPEDGCQGRQ